MRGWPRSVRARVTAAAVGIVGGLGIAAAVATPRLAEGALIDDLLDSQTAALGDAVPLPEPNSASATAELSEPDRARLAELFQPQLDRIASQLAASGATDDLRRMRPDERVVVVSAPGTAAVFDLSGTATISFDPTLWDEPVITSGQLDQLVAELDPSWFAAQWAALFEQAGTDPFGQFGTEFGTEFGAAFGETFEQTFEQTLEETFEVLLAEMETFAESAGLPPISDPELTMPGRLDPPAPDAIALDVRPIAGTDVIVAATTASVDRSVRRITTAMWAGVPIAMLLAGLAAWWLAGRALRPVRMITDRAAMITAPTGERIAGPASDDEIGRLTTVVNDMLARLERDDVRRRQFVADASHELRSPIAALRIQAEAALAAPLATDQLATDQLARGVLAETERLSTLVTDLLSLARHDERLPPPGVVVDLDDIVLAEAARPRRLAIRTSAVSAGRVRGRSDELSRLVTHLLDNAARHAQSRVEVALSTDAGRVRLIVDDDGPGIAPADRARVFERFVRLDDSRRRDAGGAGLGLAVVAAVVRASGGTVAAVDSPLGGARLVVDFPAAGDH